MKYLVSKRRQGGKKKYEQFFAPEEGNAGCLDHSEKIEYVKSAGYVKKIRNLTEKRQERKLTAARHR